MNEYVRSSETYVELYWKQDQHPIPTRVSGNQPAEDEQRVRGNKGIKVNLKRVL
jgi:hypothetical protein